MATLTELKTLCAIYLGRTSHSDLTINNFDAGLYALNAARRRIERAHDFKYAEVNGYLSIPSTGVGGALTAVKPASDLSGTAIGVKRVVSVGLPVAGSAYQPIEFMTEDEFTARLKRQIGRSTYNAALTLAQLGVSSANPLAYSQGENLFLSPITVTTTVQLNIVRWMPDYTASETDFFTRFAPEYLQWQGIVELNNYFRKFIPKQEGNIDVTEVQKMSDEALANTIEWDVSTCRGTSTPNAQKTPE